MILADSSAWIEYLRATGSPTHLRFRDLLRDGTVVACDAVRLEVLAGGRDEPHVRRLEALLDRAATLPTEAFDYDHAAMLYRACRRHGQTVRRLLDCVVAAVAIREDIAVLHADRDFDVLARHTALRVA